MKELQYTAVNLAERPDLIDPAQHICNIAWPEFMLHDAVVNKYWWNLYRYFSNYQFVLLEDSGKDILAVGNCVPVKWAGRPEELPDTGLDWILTEAFETGSKDIDMPFSLFALQIVVNPEYRGFALSTKAIQVMIAVARKNGCNALYAPVRPNHKHIYPETSIDDYIEWKNGDGRLFDPWMRVHNRLGADVIKVCHESMRISGSIAEWEKWTSMHFPSSGPYTIPGALVTVHMDLETDIGLYIEPNVWMHHKIE
ncbi:MAG: GNAT family N-acetyltransferase [Candidatus Zixiibacteriota bacterium]